MARSAASDFGVPVGNVTTVLLSLKRKGALKREGHTHQAYWSVLDENADVRSLRGTNPNSLENLRTAGGKGRSVMEAIPKFAGKGRNDWPAATMLDACWRPASYGSFPAIDANGD